MTDYDEKRKTALWVEDVEMVAETMRALENALGGRPVTDVTITVCRNDGEDLAEIWFDTEVDLFVVNWSRGSGL